MKTDTRSSRKASIFLLAGFLLLSMFACNLPKPAASTSGATSPTSTNTTIPPASGNPAEASQCLDGIQPGSTTRAEALSLLGQPAGTDDSTSSEVLLYASPIKGQYNSLVLQNETVAMLSVVLSENELLQWSAILAEFGQPTKTTFSNYLQDAMTYIYPEQGLAFVADEGMGVVFIQQCFIPMSIADYLKTWGASLPTQDPFIE